MQGYLLDTNIVAYWFDAKRPQHVRVVRRIQALPQNSPQAISVITLGEIEYGAQVASDDSASLQQALREFIDRRLPMVLGISKTTVTHYGMLRARLFETYAPRGQRR